MDSSSEVERLVFEKIAPSYENDGFEFVDPKSVNIPTGKWGYVPDFVAKRGDEFVAIEVKSRRSVNVEKSLQKLKEQIEESGDWKFLAYYAEDVLQENLFAPVGAEIIILTLEEVHRAGQSGYLRSAFLLAWGTFEAAARKAHSHFFAKPQTPGRIITVLAERGELTPEEADSLRRLAALRNALIHGQLSQKIDLADVESVAGAASRLNGARLE